MNQKLNFINVLAVFIVSCCMIYFYLIVFDSPKINTNNTGEIKTALIAVLMLICNYYYGSSRASAAKDETIKDLHSQMSGDNRMNVGDTKTEAILKETTITNESSDKKEEIKTT